MVIVADDFMVLKRVKASDADYLDPLPCCPAIKKSLPLFHLCPSVLSLVFYLDLGVVSA